jgi:hypothetical protein
MKPSIAVLPFRLLGDAVCMAVAEALPTSSSISRACAGFRDRPRLVVPVAHVGCDMGRSAGCSEPLPPHRDREILGKTLVVSVELVDTQTPESFGPNASPARRRRAQRAEEIRSRVLAALEIQILLRCCRLRCLNVSEDRRLVRPSPGLQHLYRFNRQDNAAATALFRAPSDVTRLRGRTRDSCSSTSRRPSCADTDDIAGAG